MSSDLLAGSTAPWFVALAAATLAVVVLAVAVVVVRSRARSRRALERVLAETEELRREVEELRRDGRSASRSSVPYVITGVGHEEPAPRSRAQGAAAEPAPDAGAARGPAAATLPAQADGRIDGRLFADLVLRESAVRAAGLVHGVRRALAPEARHRIRFEMGRELKRARKQRRADVREARRRLHAEQRARADAPGTPSAREQGAA